MSDVSLSQHALVRMAQRGIEMADLDLIMAIGSEVDDGVLVRKKDVKVMERAARALLQRLKKIEGKRFVMSGGCVVTAYHASSREEHRLLRPR